MSYNYVYNMEGPGFILALLFNLIPTGAFALLTYILSSWSLYAISKRRGLRNPWMSWVPVLSLWQLGCISDQYQYVVKGQYKSRRKILLVLSILTWVLIGVVAVLGFTSAAGLISGAMAGVSEAEIFSAITKLLLGVLGFCLPLAVLAITLAVFRFIALYDLYMSCVPQNATLFLVVSILFKVTEPFFLFFCKGKDEGMPPRRPEPAQYTQPDPVYESPAEPWDNAE